MEPKNATPVASSSTSTLPSNPLDSLASAQIPWGELSNSGGSVALILALHLLLVQLTKLLEIAKQK